MAKKMMAGGGYIWVMCLVVLGLMGSKTANAAVDCGQVLQDLIPCEQFLVGTVPQPDGVCCDGARALDKIASASQPDRQAICWCLKTLLLSLPIQLPKAAQIPSLCHLSTHIKIEPKTDCSKI